MQFKTSAVRTILTASCRNALMAGVCAATMGLVACGSDSTKSTTTTGSTTGDTTGTTTGSTTGATTGTTTGQTPATQDCTPSGNSKFVGESPGVTLTPVGGTAIPMPYVLFIYNPNATDTNKKYAVSVFDYDYCAFSYDHGYSNWPIDGFHAASFYLLDSANTGGSFATGDYTVGGDTQSIYISSTAGAFGSGVTETTAGGAGAACTGQTYPTLNTGGKVSITSAPGTGTNAISGVPGSFNVTLSDGSILAGSFTSGTCSASTTPTPPTPDLCACTLGSGTSTATTTTTGT